LVRTKNVYKPVEENLKKPLHLTENNDVNGAEECMAKLCCEAAHWIGRFCTVENGLPNIVFA
jgi:hypothetical protein